MSTRRSAALTQGTKEMAALVAPNPHKQETQNIYKKPYPFSDPNAQTKVEVK